MLSGLSPLSIGFSGVSVDEADGRRVALWQQPAVDGVYKGPADQWLNIQLQWHVLQEWNDSTESRPKAHTSESLT